MFLKIFTGWLTSKAIAVFIGPSGMAFTGNFRNFMSSLDGISTLAFPSGIVKYVGENEENEKELAKIISTVLLTFLGISILLSILILMFSEFLSLKIFDNSLQFDVVFKFVAVVLPFNVVSVLFISIINGLGKYSKVILANILTNILAAMLTIALIYYFKMMGALVSIALNPVLLFVVNFFYLPKELFFFKKISFKNYDFGIIKKLLGFSLMILPSVLMGPFFSLQIRNYLIDHVGVNESGFWEAIARVSSLYLIFVSTLVSVYFYPRLVKANNKTETKQVFWNYYKAILPLFVIGATLVYFLRFFIIDILYTEEFLPVSELFFWQLTADFFKVTGMILGFQFLAKKIILPYIIFEIISNSLVYILSLYCINAIGIQGVVVAQAVNNCIYVLILAVYFRKSLF